MGLAFGALLLATILLPGILFRYAYLRSDSLRKTVDFSLLSEAVFVLIPTLILHAFGWGLARLVGPALNLVPDLGVFYRLITGQLLTDAGLLRLERGLIPFILYILLLGAVAGWLGTLVQRWVLRNAWDDHFKLLRIFNDWDKYFTGHSVSGDPRRSFDYVQVDVVVQSGEGDILYTGALANYSLNQEQGIDRIFMEVVYRRRLSDDLRLSETALADLPPANREEDPRYYNMPGDYLVIPFGQIRNLNISYKKFETQAE
ncbi:hypothetical protein CLV84_2589 [Neolewinella xylanilytica]|uniref:Uncharacterized protein n=1 Tax=Neolewinella xylanilytica TaxID=1514080 RepID=A0A2S6I3D0_9BACT|nr:DUF6338 family protein [Neolewinella xylanilytica]PPK85686.1 hypothetical protein CLV84_2589 [Neolewinella xylanilytica]